MIEAPLKELENSLIQLRDTLNHAAGDLEDNLVRGRALRRRIDDLEFKIKEYDAAIAKLVDAS
jgi:hypothetical protein